MASARRDAATTDAVPINRLRAPAGSSDQGTGDSYRYRVGRERTASLTAWTMMSKSYGLPITS
jgi:hypothetical protein